MAVSSAFRLAISSSLRGVSALGLFGSLRPEHGRSCSRLAPFTVNGLNSPSARSKVAKFLRTCSCMASKAAVPKVWANLPAVLLLFAGQRFQREFEKARH